MTLVPWLSDRMWTPLPIEEVRERIDSRFQSGSVSDDRFTCKITPGNKNSWRPQAVGRLAAAADGTFIEVEYQLGLGIILFTLVHGMILLGLAWLLGIFGYLNGVKQVREALTEALEITLTGRLALEKCGGTMDPASLGASAGAPLSLRASTSLDAVTFRIGKQSLKVNDGGFTLLNVTYVWNDLAYVVVTDEGWDFGVEGRDAVTLPGAGVGRRDREWLAAFLNVRNTRGSSSADDRQRLREAERELSRLG